MRNKRVWKAVMGEEVRYLVDEAATERFGRLLAQATQGGPHFTSEARAGSGGPDVRATLGGRIFLSGDLGAGKTTLTRGLVRGYGIAGAVKSPTYTLVEPYEQPGCNLYHFDLYRLADPEEVEFLGVADYFDEANLCVIEWAEKGKGFLPASDLDITLSHEGTGRRVHWQARSSRGETIVKKLSDLLARKQTGINPA